MTSKQLFLKYKKLDLLARRHGKALTDFLSDVRENHSDKCTHRETHKNKSRRDDGYGKWWDVWIESCDICGKSRSAYDEHGAYSSWAYWDSVKNVDE